MDIYGRGQLSRETVVTIIDTNSCKEMQTYE